MCIKILLILTINILIFSPSHSRIDEDFSNFKVITIDLEKPKYTIKFPPQNKNDGTSKNSKILHGNPAFNGQFPFAAFLHIYRRTATTFCTGALIASDWIITARTCFVINPNLPADGLTAFLGSNDNSSPALLSSYANRGAFFNNNDGNNPNIAVFRLDNSMPTTNFIRPIRLPRLVDENFGFDDFNITTIGWGRLADNSFPRILQFGQFRVLAVHLCFWNRNFSTFDFCSQHQNLLSMVAERDFGGPSVIVENDGQITLIGITSMVMNLPNGSAVSSLRVSSFLRFINANTGIPFR